jgi:hypothetical protein
MLIEAKPTKPYHLSLNGCSANTGFLTTDRRQYLDSKKLYLLNNIGFVSRNGIKVESFCVASFVNLADYLISPHDGASFLSIGLDQVRE